MDADDRGPVPPCPACGCCDVFRAEAAPDEQRIQPVYLRCCQCRIERADLESGDDALERAPVPPCPACGCREVITEPVGVVRLSLFGPPVARKDELFLCRDCGVLRDDYDPDDWPDDGEPWTACDTLPRA